METNRQKLERLLLELQRKRNNSTDTFTKMRLYTKIQKVINQLANLD
jgi:hypothetical protein